MNISKGYDLTHPQKRIWYIEKMNHGYSLHNIGGYLSIFGSIDVVKLNITINKLIENNEGLRLKIFEKNAMPFQYVEDYKYEIIDFIELTKEDKVSVRFIEEMPFNFNLYL